MPQLAFVPLKIISAELATTLSFVCTTLYVAVLYLHPSARPTKFVTKDNPRVIKSRIALVSVACLAASYITVSLGKAEQDNWYGAAVRILGLHLNLHDVFRSLALTATLFAAPLYESLIAEGRILTIYQDVTYPLKSWVGFRNLVAGPLSEEFVFRSCIVPLHVFAGQQIGRVVLLTPLYFGLAHIHHIYERTITHRGQFLAACTISIVQFTYTTIFGWFAAFLFIRTGSVWSSIMVHSFCNSMGLPRVTGRVEGHILHSFIYYPLLICGVLLFARNIETWTASSTPYQPFSLV